MGTFDLVCAKDQRLEDVGYKQEQPLANAIFLALIERWTANDNTEVCVMYYVTQKASIHWLLRRLGVGPLCRAVVWC